MILWKSFDIHLSRKLLCEFIACLRRMCKFVCICFNEYTAYMCMFSMVAHSDHPSSAEETIF